MKANPHSRGWVRDRVVFVDSALLVLDKPSGLLAVPGRGEDKQDCLLARVQLVYPEVLVVHRLDMATSGLMLFARNPVVQGRLGYSFQTRQVDKRYVAIVAGRLPEAAGEIDLPLAADWPNRPRQKICTVAGKPSLTRYRVLQYDPAADASRLELEPVTGRTHQLRVHLQAIGHPIVGDALYAPAASGLPCDRLLLHASALSLPHPVSGMPLQLASPPPF